MDIKLSYQITFKGNYKHLYSPAIKQLYEAGIPAGHPWGWSGSKFWLLTASRPKTKTKLHIH